VSPLGSITLYALCLRISRMIAEGRTLPFVGAIRRAPRNLGEWTCAHSMQVCFVSISVPKLGAEIKVCQPIA
jgi:hypothetical protein